ncbi:hypothetical protein SLUN_09595 [Streptomyces lunaelactis]|uniref:Uncharacterized protein n=1 Tax=Streptomyces lunaelactis TaxID=1535768 RepID=A0A2R4TDX6_9ACTN|nr:DUF6343 family protein [Streptomyces lunaelactis]AVZ77334.1 hypothetical protein SLUN_09595 [Streptomyces lunaelactis]NUK05037.1 hypothetical protein [Streptomyces lunaelactis]NUK11696.1 hypothetical protein [Streptomyces lunaelactis]NUK20194.1 hypothetical protein [Streptomyces lunaelactis]NUK26834.1 hypothetical protein [Streptomyces lunaelactis]
MRTGSEPTTARSPLRLRFWLSVWGLIWAAAGTAFFTLAGRPGWAAACGVLLLIVAVDLAMVLRHIHQGPHYQPGRDIPPYEPDHGGHGPVGRGGR